MQSVELSGLDQMLEAWDALQRDYPELKRDMLDDIGKQILSDVREEIPGTGTVRSWQERYIGSRNGYVAVRPKAKTYQTTKSGKQYAVGYVTNAIENGHKHRKPRQTPREGYKYRGRLNVPAVPGLHFYRTVRGQLVSMGNDELQALAATVAARLGGER